MEQPIFYFKTLTTKNIISLASYLVVSIAIYYYISPLTLEDKQSYIFGYAILTQLFLYMFGYKALRNMSYFVCWVVIALIHLFIYLNIKDSLTTTFMTKGANTGLRNTIFLLILFQILRVISLNVQHQELVVPSKGGKMDLYEERKFNFLDFLFFLVYVAGVVVPIAWD